MTIFVSSEARSLKNYLKAKPAIVFFNSKIQRFYRFFTSFKKKPYKKYVLAI